MLREIFSRVDDDTLRIARTVSRLWRDVATEILVWRAGAAGVCFCLTKRGATATPAILEMSKMESKKTGPSMFAYSCTFGHEETARYVAEKYGLAKEDILSVQGNYCVKAVCMRGHLRILQWMVEKWKITREELFAPDGSCLGLASRRGQLHVAQWLVNKYNLTASEAIKTPCASLSQACSGGQLHVIQWLCNKFDIMSLENRLEIVQLAVFHAGRYGMLDVMEWLIHNFGVTAEDTYIGNSTTLAMFCMTRNLPAAKRLTEILRLTPAYARTFSNTALRQSIIKGCIYEAQWLVTKFELTVDDVREGNALAIACCYGRLELAKWLTQHFTLGRAEALDDNMVAVEYAIAGGHIQTLRWMTEQFNLTPDVLTIYTIPIYAACYRGHLETLEWGIANARDMYSRGPVCANMMQYAVRGRQTAVMRWLIDRYDSAALKPPQEELAVMMSALCGSGELPQLQQLVRMGLDVSDLATSGGFQLACMNGHVDTVRWLFERYAIGEYRQIIAESMALAQVGNEESHPDVMRYLTTAQETVLPTNDSGGLVEELIARYTAQPAMFNGETATWVERLGPTYTNTQPGV